MKRIPLSKQLTTTALTAALMMSTALVMPTDVMAQTVVSGLPWDAEFNPSSHSYDIQKIELTKEQYETATQNGAKDVFAFNETDETGNWTTSYYQIKIKSDLLTENSTAADALLTFTQTEADGTVSPVYYKYAAVLPADGTQYYIGTASGSPVTGRLDNASNHVAGSDITGMNGAPDKGLFKDYSATTPSGTYLGGLISNSNSSSQIGHIYADFINNTLTISSISSSLKGGILYNKGTIKSINGDFINNQVVLAAPYAYTRKDLIYNEGTIGSINGNFINNNSDTSLIYQFQGGRIDKISGSFIGNSVDSGESSYALIVIERGTVGEISGDFINNNALSVFISSDSRVPIDKISGSFISNKGAIAHGNGELREISGTFIKNSSSFWGGGAIRNSQGNGDSSPRIEKINGTFIANSVFGASSGSATAIAVGGAIGNGAALGRAVIYEIAGLFQENVASATGTGSKAVGGAIASLDTASFASYSAAIGKISGDFIQNKAEAESAYGGAVYLLNSENVSVSGSFFNNRAQGQIKAQGGAIYTNVNSTLTYTFVPETGTVPTAVSDILGEGKDEWIASSVSSLQINAEQKDSIFSSNRVEIGGAGKKNDIYIDGIDPTNGADGLIFKVIADDDLLQAYSNTLSTSVKSDFEKRVSYYKAGTGGLIGSRNYSLESIIGQLKKSDRSAYTFLQDQGLADQVMGIPDVNVWDLKLNASAGRLISFDGGIDGNLYSVHIDGAGTVRLKDSYLLGAQKLKVSDGLFDITTSQVEAQEVEFSSGSSFGVTLNEDDTSGTIKAGKISIGENVQAQVLVSFDMAHSAQKEYEVLTATESLTGVFADTQISNNLFDITYESKENAGVFNIQRKAIDPATDSAKKYAHVEKAWFDSNEYPADSRAKQIADDLFCLAQNDDAAFRNKLAEIAPSAAPVKMEIAVSGIRKLGRLTRNALNKQPQMGAGLSSGDAEQDKALWMQVGYGYYNYSGKGAFNGHQKFIVAGADKDVSLDLELGLGVGYNENNLKEQSRETKIKGYEFFGYGRYLLTKKARVDGVVSYMGSRYEEEGFSGLNDAKHNTDALGVEVMGGYDILQSSRFGTVGLNAGGWYVFLHQREYDDKVGQEIKSENRNQLTFKAGASYETAMNVKSFTITPKLGIVGTYDVVKERTHGETKVANGLWYTMQNDVLKRWGLETTAIVNVLSAGGVSLTVSYEGAFKKHYENHTVSLKGKVEF